MRWHWLASVQSRSKFRRNDPVRGGPVGNCSSISSLKVLEVEQFLKDVEIQVFGHALKYRGSCSGSLALNEPLLNMGKYYANFQV